MPKAKKTHQPHDNDIVRLNSLGFSLSGIGKKVGCHPSTVTSRLSIYGVEPADTRRCFMEDIYEQMTEDQMNWLSQQLGPHVNIKDYIRDMLVSAFMQAKIPSQQAA